jgi:hypothetical protein
MLNWLLWKMIGGWSPDSLTHFADAVALFFAQRRRAQE